MQYFKYLQYFIYFVYLLFYIIISIISEECPPGTRARKKQMKHRKHGVLERKTLKPHCRSCNYGSYQSDYGQTSCLKCPQGFNTTTMGAVSLAQCLPAFKTPCSGKDNICNHGQCVPENDFYYSCSCSGSYIGSLLYPVWQAATCFTSFFLNRFTLRYTSECMPVPPVFKWGFVSGGCFGF